MSLRVQPESVDFGAIRKGDQRSVKLQVTVTGIEGNVAGCVGRKPEWLKITPADFDRPRQTLTLSANSARAFETGDFQETLSLITKAGTTEIPIHLRVLKPRPTFGQIAFWFVPLFAFTLFPVIAVAFAGGGHALAVNGGLAPSAALATGMLSIMLLLIGIAADIGMAERAACGVLMAAMCFVLGVAVSTRGLNHSFPPGMQRVVLTGSIFGMVVLLQLIHLKRWKLWAFVLACLGLLMGGNFLHLLTV